MKLSYWNKAKLLAPAVAVLVSTILFGCIQVFLQNQREMLLGLADICFLVLCAALVPLGVFAALAALLPSAGVRAIAGFLTGTATALYVQGNFMQRSFGQLDGSDIRWSKFLLWNWIDPLVWIILILGFCALAFRYERTLQHVRFGIFLMILATLGLESRPTEIRWRGGEGTRSLHALSDLHAQSNIIVIVLDSFQSLLFEHVLKSNPEYYREFRDFVFYPDTLGGFPRTAASVPLLLSTTWYRNREPLDEFYARAFSGDHVASELSKHGYQSAFTTLAPFCQHLQSSWCMSREAAVAATHGVDADFLKVIDTMLFRYLPQPLKQAVYDDERWFLQRLFISGARSGLAFGHAVSLNLVDWWEQHVQPTSPQPKFLFLHLNPPHAPQQLDPSCSRLSGPVMKHSQESLTRSIPQARCALTLTLRIIRQLRTLNVYDQSMIVILADHGSGTNTDPRLAKPKQPPIRHATPLLLIKPPHAQSEELRRSTVPAHLADIPKTIVETVLGASHFAGLNLIKADGEKRVRTYQHYRFSKKTLRRNRLPELVEYRVTGPVHDPRSWQRKRG